MAGYGVLPVALPIRVLQLPVRRRFSSRSRVFASAVVDSPEVAELVLPKLPRADAVVENFEVAHRLRPVSTLVRVRTGLKEKEI